MYVLDYPEFFHLLWGLIFFVALFWFWHKWRQKQRLLFFDLKLYQNLAGNTTRWRHFYKQLLFMLIVILAILAMINPKAGTKTKTIARKGVDIVFMLDVSKSMDVKDVAPSRLEKAKNMIIKILNKLTMDRVGLVIYAGGAYPLVPMTSDYAALKNFLGSVDSELMSSKGTAFSLAFRIVGKLFNSDTLNAKNRVLVILSDGEDHMGINTNELTNILRGVKMFTVGIGTETGGPVPDATGDFKKDAQGHTVISKLRPENLKPLAELSRGLFILSDDSDEVAAYFNNFLVTIEKIAMNTTDISDYEYQYVPILLLAIFLLIIDTFILTRKNQWKNS